MGISSKKMSRLFFLTSQSPILYREINGKKALSPKKEAAVKCLWIAHKHKRKFSICLKKFSALKSGSLLTSLQTSTPI